MRTRTVGFLALLLVGATALAAGCSLVNAPDDIQPGTTGSGGGTGGSGGAPPECTQDDQCASLATECADASCAGGVCTTVPKASDTPCGATPTTTCDLADTCDGAGTCVNAMLPDGAYCEDCAAGPGQCARCATGACGDCTTRATEKSFRTSVSADGWTLTGSWAIRSETPPPSPSSNPDCNNGSDDDNDTFTDYPDDPDCASPIDNSEFSPSACSDGFDDDSDTLIDFPNDPGCSAAGDDSETFDRVPFDHPVLGTDGNRAHAYEHDNVQFEGSFALSPPTVIPSELRFKSWNLDEGSFFDRKAIQITTDVNPPFNFTTIVICQSPSGTCTAEGDACAVSGDCCSALCVASVCAPPPAFCDFVDVREPDAWDDIVLPVPAALVGQTGRVQFKYDTRDECCDFERGWYIDALNFAGECACSTAADCAVLDGTCATGTCDQATSECRLTPMSAGSACQNDATTNDCSAPTCDGHGICNKNVSDTEGLVCSQCTDPDGECSYCVDGSCASCWPTQTFSGNENVSEFFDTSDWTFTGDWGLNEFLVRNSVTPTMDEFFELGNNEKRNDPTLRPVLGNDGSRVSGGTTSEVETGSVTTSLTLIPATLTFNSWHQDRGGNDTFSLRDKKQIFVSTDDGATWQLLFDCEGKTTPAFCVPWPTPSVNRVKTSWDAISIPVPAAFAGQLGRLRFVYDTVDAGGGWERGWFIDDINVSRCD